MSAAAKLLETSIPDATRRRVTVEGELDLLSGGELTAVAGALATAPLVTVDLDLAGVTFLDTAGWNAVAAARRLITGAGGTCAVVAMSPAVHRYLRLAQAASPVHFARGWATGA